METVAASDAELVDASRRGERAAFGELIERCARMVEAVAYAATRDHALSEDISQDTFVAAWRDLDRLRDVTAVRPWLCGIARNLAHKARRRRGREVVSDDIDVATDRTPFDVIADGQAEHVVTAALARVPDRYREALVLFYYEQHSAKDVATALGVSEDVVHKRLSRGRRYLARGVEQRVEHALERPHTRRDLAACVLTALAVATPTRAEAASWKLGALGIAATTIAVTAVAAWSRPVEPQDRVTRAAPRPIAAATTRVASAPPPRPALPTTAVVMPTCATAARHMVELLSAATDEADDARRFERPCRDERWSQREVACMVAADDAFDAQACKVPRPLPAPALAPPGELGCGTVADHMLAVSPPPADDPRPEAQYASLRANLVEICANEAWSELSGRGHACVGDRELPIGALES